jgi:NADPH-dependent glutamate synthase beta subunit-like oxidoreductase
LAVGSPSTAAATPRWTRPGPPGGSALPTPWSSTAASDTGFPQPTGEFTELDGDTVVLALGQEAELSLLDGVPGVTIRDGVIKVGGDLMSGRPGIFAGGDMVPPERTVTVGIGHGKKAAYAIDAWAAPCTP